VLKKQTDTQGNPVSVTLLHTWVDNADTREEMLCFVKCIEPSRRLADIGRTLMLLMLCAIALKDSLLQMTWPFSTECTVNLVETTGGNKGYTVRINYNRTFLPQGSCNHSPATCYHTSSHFSSATGRTGPNQILYSLHLATYESAPIPTRYEACWAIQPVSTICRALCPCQKQNSDM
jgi:hypothetical protein